MIKLIPGADIELNLSLRQTFKKIPENAVIVIKNHLDNDEYLKAYKTYCVYMPSNYNYRQACTARLAFIYRLQEKLNIDLLKYFKVISDDIFSFCSFIESIDIPEGVERIGDSAFYEADHLKSVTIPDSLKEIDDCAFFRCEKLESINPLKNVLRIGNYAFDFCLKLPKLLIQKDAVVGKEYFPGNVFYI